MQETQSLCVKEGNTNEEEHKATMWQLYRKATRMYRAACPIQAGLPGELF